MDANIFAGLIMCGCLTGFGAIWCAGNWLTRPARIVVQDDRIVLIRQR